MVIFYPFLDFKIVAEDFKTYLSKSAQLFIFYAELIYAEGHNSDP
jgi:hypothetical protein